MGDREDYRTIAACANCGRPTTAQKVSDGSIRPIGGENECIYGETEFVEVDSETVFDEDTLINPED